MKVLPEKLTVVHVVNKLRACVEAVGCLFQSSQMVHVMT